ncbi:hypothetical protein DOY81_000761 [Sarcophaga bullata]|nr:hypothetical protein DOY81_000761 [Sarcophaga bullata]
MQCSKKVIFVLCAHWLHCHIEVNFGSSSPSLFSTSSSFYTFSGSGNFRSQQWHTKALNLWPKADHIVIDIDVETLQLDVCTPVVAAAVSDG